jgi:hypothetical protein
VSEVGAAFKALTPEQRGVVTDKRVAGARSPDEWLALLGPVAEFDLRADEVRQGGGGFFARRFARKHDLPDGFRSFAVPLLPLLREDHDPAAALELRIDLTGAEQSAKQTGTSDPYKKGAYHKIVDTFYDDPWLEGHAQFADGADVRFAAIDHVRVSQKTKRSASGKTKHKKRSKKKTELAVTVSFPARNYDALSQSAPVPGVRKQSVRAGEKRTVVRLSRLVNPATVDAAPELGHLIELLTGAYTRVDPARRKKL